MSIFEVAHRAQLCQCSTKRYPFDKFELFRMKIGAAYYLKFVDAFNDSTRAIYVCLLRDQDERHAQKSSNYSEI